MNKINLRKPFFLLLFALASYFLLDKEISLKCATFSKAYRPFLKGCTLLIFPPLYLILSLGALAFCRLKKSPLTHLFFEIFVSQCLSVAFVRVSKILIGKARPDIFLKKGIYGFYGFEWDHHFHSFPSGHSMAVFTLTATLSHFFPRFTPHFFIVGSTLAMSRILLLGHFLSDVIGTCALSMIIASAVHLFIQSIQGDYIHESI